MSKDKKKKLQGFDKAVLKRVLTHIKKYRILVILSFVCAMITVASTLYAPILTGDAIDLIVGKGLVDFDGIKDIIYTFLMVTVVTVISQWFMNIINNHITYSVVRDIRIEVFNHMEELPLSYIDSHKHGDIVSRIVSDIDQFADGLLMGFTQLFTGIVTILATLGFMIAVNGQEIEADGKTIAEYLDNSSYDIKRIAVEMNGEILPKSQYNSVIMKSGDKIEIVSFVGGG